MKKQRLILIIILVLFLPVLTNAKTKFLYDVIKDATEENLAHEYNGNHHDSFTEEPSQKIYYWYAINSTQGNIISERDNVVFGNTCWQMIRTTDTGGVKLLYNGEYDEVNKCSNSRPTHYGYSTGAWTSSDSVYLVGNYYYGSDYTYNAETNTFSLSGTTFRADYRNNPQRCIGYYTCKSSSVNGTCTFLFYVVGTAKVNSNYGLATQLKKINYSYIGETGHLDTDQNISSSFADIGYSAGTTYTYSATVFTPEKKYSSNETVLSSGTIGTAFYYSDTYNYDSTTGKYSLVNPYVITSSDDYPSIVGKYTLRNTSETFSNNSIYYISSVNGNYMYYNTLSNSNDVSSLKNILIGDSIIENQDGTYSLSNTTSINFTDWYTNYASYSKKYTCLNTSGTCNEPRYISSANNTSYNYIKYTDKVMIGKGIDGTTLTDPLLVRTIDLSFNYNDYSDYKYTCNTTSAECSSDNISYITYYAQEYFSYRQNYYYGNSVTWDGSKYTLIDPVHLDEITYSDHHYVCLTRGTTSCTMVGYTIYHNNGSLVYIELKNGKNMSEALDEMHSNGRDSIIKIQTEEWYRNNMLPYDEYIEDTIYCNERGIITYGPFDKDTGALGAKLNYAATTSEVINFSCQREEDKFSINNPNAQLKYKVGLPTIQEMAALHDKSMRTSSNGFWTMSPNYHHERSSYYHLIRSDGSFNKINIHGDGQVLGVRPVISLKPKMRYSTGDGSTSNPYIVDFNEYYSVNVEIKNETEDLNVEIDDMTTVAEGEDVTFKVTPIKGYKVTNIEIIDADNNEIDYEETDNKNEYTFKMPAKDVTIIPSYEKVSNAVEVEDNKNTKEITIEVNDVKAVVYEETVKFTIIPEDGYELETIIITDEEGNNISYKKTNKENEYEFTMPDTDVLIKPVYRKIPDNNTPNNPKTGRSILFVFFILILGLVTILKHKKRLN